MALCRTSSVNSGVTPDDKHLPARATNLSPLEPTLIVLLDTPDDLSQCEAELGCEVEQLFTPLTRRDAQRPDARFSIDNGAFSTFRPDAFRTCLRKHADRRELCRFVAVPDVVGSARRTLEVFEHWRYDLTGWPLALVAQDGQEDLDIPWKGIAAIFIGGSTKWKLSESAAAVIKAGIACEKWVHVGRVNTPARFEYFSELGAHSIDGTGLARYSHMREAIWKAHSQPNLLT